MIGKILRLAAELVSTKQCWYACLAIEEAAYELGRSELHRETEQFFQSRYFHASFYDCPNDRFELFVRGTNSELARRDRMRALDSCANEWETDYRIVPRET